MWHCAEEQWLRVWQRGTRAENSQWGVLSAEEVESGGEGAQKSGLNTLGLAAP